VTATNVSAQRQESGACGTKGQAVERDVQSIEHEALRSRMRCVAKKILVLSGKGGVGKSTVAANLAVSLAMAGKQVGLLDVDVHGPSVPKLLKIEHTAVAVSGNTLLPVSLDFGAGLLRVMSIGLLLQKSDAVIWRGPKKFGLIKQFLQDVEWGALDYLFVDCPPGTGDEPLAVAQLIESPDGAVVVTTPQQIATQDVRRSIEFCHALGVPVLGLVENMSGFKCPHCGEVVNIFGTDGGRALAQEMSVPFLGCIPIEPDLVASGDKGAPIVQADPHCESSKAFGRIVRALLSPEPSASARDQMDNTI